MLMSPQSTHGLTSEQRNTWCRMDFTTSGIGLMIVSSIAAIAPRLYELLGRSLMISPRNMASFGKSNRRNTVSGIDGYQRRDLPCTSIPYFACRYTQHLRSTGSRLLGPYRLCIISFDIGNVAVAISRTIGGHLHGHHPRIHF